MCRDNKLGLWSRLIQKQNNNHKSTVECIPLPDFTEQDKSGHKGPVKCPQCQTLGKYVCRNHLEKLSLSIKNHITETYICTDI